MFTILMAFLSKFAIGIVAVIGGLIWYGIQRKNPNPFSMLKFLGIFNFSIGAVVGKWAVYLFAGLIACHLYYNALIRPTYKTVDNSKTTIGTVQKYYTGPENRPDTNFYGFKLGPLGLGVTSNFGQGNKAITKKEAVIKPVKKSFNLFNIFKKK